MSKIDIQGAYIAGANKPYIFEDNNFKPVSQCKVVDLESVRAYALPAYPMSEDWFIEGKTEAPAKAQKRADVIDYLIQEVDAKYIPVDLPYFFNKTESAVYCPLTIDLRSESLHVVTGSLFDAFSIDTEIKKASVIYCPELKDFRIPASLQSIVKEITIWINNTTNEIIQKERISNVNEIAELYGNLCTVKHCIPKSPERDQVEITWNDDRGAIQSAYKKAKRLRSQTGRYPSPPEYLIYPGKEVFRINHKGEKIPTGIMDALFVDRIYAKDPAWIQERNPQDHNFGSHTINVETLKKAFIIGFRTATGATVLLPVGASILTEGSKQIFDQAGRNTPDSLGLLASSGMPISLDNLEEVRRLILASNHSHRGCGNYSLDKPFPARQNMAFTKDNLKLAEFY